MSCLDEETVAGCIEDRLTVDERAAALLHIDDCDRCRRLLALTARSLLDDDLDEHERPPPLVVAIGSFIGRYRVRARIGGGAMGEVFAATDPQLGRDVAVKVLRSDLTDTVAAAQRARLVLEAQALARITHPNVVSVYDVGIADSHIFIAMELVKGGTLTSWLDTPRSWREVLAVMQSAGRGLAAVHAAGLIHRDFKLDNVLIGDDGRVCVTDFGLARVSDAGDDPRATEGRLALGPVHVTRTGALLGTPSYMPPEQLRGEPATAASDQFAFCAALYEALLGVRPFAGGSVEELLAAHALGQLRPPLPTRARVPGFVRSALRRGLSSDPAHRFVSMDALLSALAAGLRRPGLWLRGALAAAAMATVVMLLHPWQKLTCPRIDTIWTSARRAQLAAAFHASGRPSAVFVWGAVERALDRFAGAWQERQEELCAAPRDRSPAVAETEECLQDLRLELGALLASFEKADVATISHALGAAESLTSLSQCRSAHRRSTLSAAHRQPLEAELAWLNAADNGSHIADAWPRAAAAVDRAHALGDRWMEARALLLRGRLLLDGGDAKGAEPVLFAAYTAASEVGDDALAAQAGIQEMFALGTRLSRVDEARRWAALTHALVKRVGDDDLTATFDDTQGTLLTQWGQFDEAIASLTHALAGHRRLRGNDSYAVVRDLHNLAEARLEREDGKRRDVETAQTLEEEALGIALHLFGPVSPTVGGCYDALGGIATRQGRYNDAQGLLEKSLQIRRATLPADHTDIAESLGGLASVLVALDRQAEALVDLNEAIAIDERKLGPDNQQLAMWIDTRGDVDRELHRYDAALVDYRRALAMLEHAPDAGLRAIPLIGVGQTEARARQCGGRAGAAGRSGAAPRRRSADQFTRVGDGAFLARQSAVGDPRARARQKAGRKSARRVRVSGAFARGRFAARDRRLARGPPVSHHSKRKTKPGSPR